MVKRKHELQSLARVMCVLAVYNEAQAQNTSNREFKLWTFLQGTESRAATFLAETSVCMCLIGCLCASLCVCVCKFVYLCLCMFSLSPPLCVCVFICDVPYRDPSEGDLE